MRFVLAGLLCSLGGLGVATWLTALCLIAVSSRLAALAAWPLAAVVVLAAIGGWTFPRSWWVVALFAGFPSLLFTTGWYFVVAGEGERNHTWLGLGALALAGALVVAFAISRWRLARMHRRDAERIA